MVRWPKKKALCFPAFSDSVYQPATDRAGEMREKGLTPEHVDNNIQAQPPLRQKREDSISLTSLSSLSSNQREEEATTAEQHSPTNTQNYTEMKEGEGDNVETSYLTNFNESADALVELLHAGPLVKGDLPRSRESLQELRLQTEMELMWLRQAIASRRKVSFCNCYVFVTFDTIFSYSICS